MCTHLSPPHLGLMTDIRQLMREIEEGLTALHQAQRDALPPSTSTPGQDEGQGPQDAVADPETPPDAGQKEEEGQGMEEEEFLAQCPPFLLVDEVAADSPAKQAGLQEGDLVLRFGHLDHNSPSYGLRALAEHVQAWRNRPMQLAILRAGKLHRLELIPREWGGRGLLGCHVVPAPQ